MAKLRIELYSLNGTLMVAHNLESTETFEMKYLPTQFIYNERPYQLLHVLFTTNHWGSHIVYKETSKAIDFEYWVESLTADPMDPNHM